MFALQRPIRPGTFVHVRPHPESRADDDARLPISCRFGPDLVAPGWCRAHDGFSAVPPACRQPPPRPPCARAGRRLERAGTKHSLAIARDGVMSPRPEKARHGPCWPRHRCDPTLDTVETFTERVTPPSTASSSNLRELCLKECVMTILVPVRSIPAASSAADPRLALSLASRKD